MDEAEPDPDRPAPAREWWAVLIAWVIVRTALETVTQFGPDLTAQITAHVIASIGDITVVLRQWTNR